MSVSYVATVQYDLPEARFLRAEVKPKCDTDLPFEIDEAHWELWYKDDSGNDILELPESARLRSTRFLLIFSLKKKEHIGLSTSTGSLMKHG